MQRNIRLLAALFAVSAVLGCGDDTKPSLTSPYADIPATATERVMGLDGPIDIVRDKFGVPHVWASTLGDAAFGDGYVSAADRLAQMNLFRHVASGTLGELFGALNPPSIDSDLSMRMHRFRPIATQTWQTLQASTDPVDKDLVVLLNRFSDGVNQYLDELKQNQHTIDSRVAAYFDPARTDPWTAVDSLTIGRFEAWAQDYSADEEIYHTKAAQTARAMFNASSPPDRARRAGLYADLWDVRPMDPTSTVDGFPGLGRRRSAAPVAARARRPQVAPAVLDSALAALDPPAQMGLQLRQAWNGSNNWVVGPKLAGAGKTLLANDPHLQLSNPSILYFIHMTVPGKLEIEGMTLPGVPGIILGHNAHVAWGGTDVNHDVTDVYQEQIAPCAAGGGDCVRFKGQDVHLETWQETIKVGGLGTITSSFTVTYERVPHHGPIIPNIVNHTIVPRTSSQALSVRYTGYEPTSEIRAVYLLAKATTVDDAFAALENWGFGALNWVVVDDQGHVGWYPHANVPWRTTPGCFGYDKRTAQDGVAPFFVLPGDGTCEWEGYMESQYLPKAKDPDTGFLATANGDPVGETADGDALNGPMVGTHRMYLGAYYDPGFRVGRITRRLQMLAQAGRPLTLDDLASVQADVHSNYGDALKPHILAALTAFSEEVAMPGRHPDLASWVAALPAAKRTRLLGAQSMFSGWTLETPPATDAQTDAATQSDSAATVLFNVWARKFLQDAFGDELAVLGLSIDDFETARAGLAVFERPTDLVSGIATQTGQPVLCDDLTTSGTVESCTLIALEALDQALDWIESAAGFGTADPTQWHWGLLHTLTLASLLPDPELNIPPPDDPDPSLRKGYPRHGDNFSVDASNPGLSGTTYSYRSGPVMRHLVSYLTGGALSTRMALPGGEVFDRSSPHYRDLMDKYWSKNQYFDFAWSSAEVHAAAEARWRLEPR